MATWYTIVYKDEDTPAAYWTTRFGETDNYSLERSDATLFASRSAARCLMDALGLNDGYHEIQEV